MAAINLIINDKEYEINAAPDMPLLWAIRDYVGLMGTKFGCGIAQCGTCTVHMNGTPVRSCAIPVKSAEKAKIKTIEGLSETQNNPIQQAWIEEQVPQCGYCQSGQIMVAAALLEKNPRPSDEDINLAMAGVICRCGTYPRIKKAILKASEMMRDS